MSSLNALRNADLDRALAELQDEVRRDPADVKHRIFLFQLLVVMGQWDRALTQLNVARDLNADALAMAQTYQEVLHCEVLRNQVFRGQRSPLFFGEPEPWMALLWQSHVMAIEGRLAESSRLRGEAYDAAPALAGQLWRHASVESASDPDELPPGESFEWIADADTRLGPVLEVIVNGRYYWLPWLRVRRVDIEKPTDLRDLVWLPAHFEWDNGGEAVGFIPSRYPGSESGPDHSIRMARRTEWLDQGENIFFGLGQRILATDQAEYPLFDLHRICCNGPTG